MKIKTILPILLVSVLTACHSDESSPMVPAVQNTNINAITTRQKLVQQFHTAEVFAFPYDAYQFVIRSTNGAVWYVNTSSNFSGITLMFPPQIVTSNSFEPPNWVSPEQAREVAAVEMTRVWTDAMVKIAEINRNITNLNSTLTNIPVMVEDPDKISSPATNR